MCGLKGVERLQACNATLITVLELQRSYEPLLAALARLHPSSKLLGTASSSNLVRFLSLDMGLTNGYLDVDRARFELSYNANPFSTIGTSIYVVCLTSSSNVICNIHLPNTVDLLLIHVSKSA